MADIDEGTIVKIAREVVMQIRPMAEVLKELELTENDFYEISKNPFYTLAKEQYALEWGAVLTTNDRVKLKSSVVLEESIATLAGRMLGPNEPLAAVADIAKFFAKTAGLGEGRPDGRSSERFTIHIDLGGNVETFDKSIVVDANDTETVYGEKELDGRSRKKAGRLAPVAGRAGGGEDPGGKDRESRALVQSDAAPARNPGKDVRQAPPRPQVEAAAKPSFKTCKVPGCGRKLIAKGLCQYHYVKERRIRLGHQ